MNSLPSVPLLEKVNCVLAEGSLRVGLLPIHFPWHTRSMANLPSGGTRYLRWILRIGATVFGLSALALLFLPETFLSLLGLDDTMALVWSMRMIAITLVALTGNMAVVSYTANETGVVAAALVMLSCAGALGVVTLLIPAPVTWFNTAYALVGFGFSAAYLVGLAQWLRPGR